MSADVLAEFGIPHEVHVMSAHRTPQRVAEFATAARAAGYGAIICGAGKAAHLAGAVAAHSDLPVIGVPIAAGKLGGMDALLATVQMPTGIPVATVAVDSAANGAYLAAAILSVERFPGGSAKNGWDATRAYSAGRAVPARPIWPS